MTQPAGRATVPEPDNRSFYSLSFWALLLAFELFVLSLPLFPTGDGGLHIYYATVFHDLVSHTSPLYAQFYAVRHLVQPYLLHYYVFIGLCSFLSPDTAEKIIVLIVLAVFACGFRSLVRGLSLDSPALALLVFPFLLNWPLSMGALNYTFALGLMMFALGSYERLSGPGPVAPRLWRFAGILLLLVFSHPVPLLLLLCIFAVDLLLRWGQDRHQPGFRATQRPRLLAFAFACIAFIVPMLIADKSQLGKTANDIRFHADHLRYLYNASRLSMFFPAGPLGRLYSRLLMLLLPASLGIVLASGFLRRAKARSLTNFDRLAIFTVLYLLATLFAPEDLNGSGYFAMRLFLPCWLLGIAASAGALRGATWNRATAVFAIAISVVTLVMAQRIVRPVARMMVELERAPLPAGRKGLFIQSQAGEHPMSVQTGYPLFWWSGARAFTTHGDVLLNSAWLDLTIIPLRENGASGLLRDYTERQGSEDPNTLGTYLAQHPDQRSEAESSADFILFSDPQPKGADPAALMRLALGSDAAHWQCAQKDFYALCTRRAGMPSS